MHHLDAHLQHGRNSSSSIIANSLGPFILILVLINKAIRGTRLRAANAAAPDKCHECGPAFWGRGCGADCVADAT